MRLSLINEISDTTDCRIHAINEAGGRIARAALAGWFLVCAVMTTGCVSRGSSWGTLSVQGHILDALGKPVEGLKLEVLLPQAYGIREKELESGQAMDFGVPKRLARFETDANGRFEGTMGDQGYQRDVWVFPPRGPVPAAPPPPSFLIRMPEISDENYYVRTERGTCVIMKPNGAHIPLANSRLVRLDSSAHVVPGGNPGTEARIEMVVDYRDEPLLTSASRTPD